MSARRVLDTAYSSWIDLPRARADLLVALDYPRWVSLGRLLRRTVVRLRTPAATRRWLATLDPPR